MPDSAILPPSQAFRVSRLRRLAKWLEENNDSAAYVAVMGSFLLLLFVLLRAIYTGEY